MATLDDASDSDSSSFDTPSSSPTNTNSHYKTATATLSAAFASLWGSYQQPGPSRKPEPSSSGWGSILGRGSSGTVASPPRGTSRGKSRGAIPFNISGPLEAGPSSPGRTKLRNVFEQPEGYSQYDVPASPRALPSTPKTPQFQDPTDSPEMGSPTDAYSTLSRLRTRPSHPSLKSNFRGFSDTTPIKPPPDRMAAHASNEALDVHVRRIVFQAGLDNLTRPMVVLSASSFPDPNLVNYDQLFDRILSTLSLFVENDYTIIYFASGGRHRPGWNWIWKAYRRLSRPFRKNLKKLYIVHPTFFTRTLMQVVNGGAYFVSPKFAKKVEQVSTLSELAQKVDVTQIDIPPEVLRFNATLEGQVQLPTKGVGKVFGVDLVTLMGENGEKGGIPSLVRDCVETILGEMDGIRPVQVEGIFRRSPSSALLKAAQESYDRGHPVDLARYSDPHIPAVLLKIYLRSLPSPLFPASFYPVIRACPNPPDVAYLRDVFVRAIEPPAAVMLLSYVLEMMHKVSLHASQNRMDAANLATVLAPNLVGSGNALKDVQMCRVDGIGSMAGQATRTEGTRLGTILKVMIERYYEIFDEVEYEPVVESWFTPKKGEDDGTPSMLTARSIASRDRGVGRNSSGSLRLTKGRLGSKNDLRAEAMTAHLSGVTLTGASAAGFFSSPTEQSPRHSRRGLSEVQENRSE